MITSRHYLTFLAYCALRTLRIFLSEHSTRAYAYGGKNGARRKTAKSAQVRSPLCADCALYAQWKGQFR
jgi:hypothetical protein